MVSFAVMQKHSILYGVLSGQRKPMTSFAEPRKNGNAPRRNVLQRNKPSERHGSVNERNAALPVCNQEVKRNPATNVRIGKTEDTVLTEEKRDFPFLTAQIVSHIKKAFSVGKFAFFHALDRAFLRKNALLQKLYENRRKNNDNEQNQKPKNNRNLF